MTVTYRRLALSAGVFGISIAYLLFTTGMLLQTEYLSIPTGMTHGLMAVSPKIISDPHCLIEGCLAQPYCTYHVSASEGSGSSNDFSIKQTDTLTIAITMSGGSSGTPTPTGSVSFLLNDVSINARPFPIISSVTQNLQNGSLVYSVKDLPVGQLGYVFQYSGDQTYSQAADCFTIGKAGILVYVTVSAATPIATATPVVAATPTPKPSSNKPVVTPISGNPATPLSTGTPQPNPVGTIVGATPTGASLPGPTPTASHQAAAKPSPANNLGTFIVILLGVLCALGGAVGWILWRARAK